MLSRILATCFLLVVSEAFHVPPLLRSASSGPRPVKAEKARGGVIGGCPALGRRAALSLYCQADESAGEEEREDAEVAVFRLKKNLAKSNVWLIGMDGCGKDAIGKDLARVLGYRFLDTNQIIGDLAKQPVDDALVDSMGQNEWMELEKGVLDQVQAYLSTIVATGSLAPLERENWAKFRTGIVAYLSSDGSKLAESGVQGPVESETAAMLPGLSNRERLGLLLAQRESLYTQADIVIEVGGLPLNEATAKLVSSLNTLIADSPAPKEPKLSEAHAQALARILQEEEKEEEKDKRPGGADVAREDIEKLYKMMDGGDGESADGSEDKGGGGKGEDKKKRGNI